MFDSNARTFRTNELRIVRRVACSELVLIPFLEAKYYPIRCIYRSVPGLTEPYTSKAIGQNSVLSWRHNAKYKVSYSATSRRWVNVFVSATRSCIWLWIRAYVSDFKPLRSGGKLHVISIDIEPSKKQLTHIQHHALDPILLLVEDLAQTRKFRYDVMRSRRL